MNIYDVLSKDHRHYETLLDDIVASSQKGDDAWKAKLDELRRDLIAHSRAEESVLYNALREEEVAKGLVVHSYAEHALAETELHTLGLAKLIDKSWTGLAEKLRKDLRHHIHEEETKIYAAARKAFSDAEAKQLGSAFARLKKELHGDGDSPLASQIDLVANLLPPRLSKRFREEEAKTRERMTQLHP